MTEDSSRVGYSLKNEKFKRFNQQLGPPLLERAVSGDIQQDSDGSYSRVYLRCYAELPIGQSLAVLGMYIYTYIHTYMYR